MKRASLPLLSSLRWRLSIAISGVVLLCAALCIAGAVLFLQQALVTRATNDLQHTLDGTAAYINKDQRSDLLGQAELIAADPAVRADVRRGDRQSLTTHLTLYFADLGNVDVLDVVDGRGSVLVRMEDTLSYGDNVSARASVRAGLADKEIVAAESDLPNRESAGGYALRATVPLHDGSRVIGVVSVGRLLDSWFAKRIGHAVSSDVSLIAGSMRTGTTLTDAHGLPATGLPEPPSIIRRIADGHTSVATVNENGRSILSGVLPLEDATGRPVGAVEVIRPLGPIYDVITKLSLLLLALGVAVVAVGTMLAMGLGSRLTRRLLTLEATAAHVAGRASDDTPFGDLHSALTPHGDDEVASLARSFSAMMTVLDERMAANARLYAAAQGRVHELTGLAEVARMLTAGTSLQETLDRLSEHVCRLVGCAAVAIRVPGTDNEPTVYGGYGLPDGYAAAVEAVLALVGTAEYRTVTEIALQTGRPAWHRVDGLPESHALLRRNALASGWGGTTAVPLRLQDRAIGVLLCYTVSAEPLSDRDLSLLTTIADQVAVAVQNARLHARARDLAALDERARLARELHDSVTQALFSMTLHARAAQMALGHAGIDAASPLGRNVRQMHELTQSALAEMRALIFELRPGALSEEGLAAALRKQAAAISAREGLVVDVQAPEERLPIESATEEHLYRMAQEALHNVIKHAHASRVWVQLAAPTADSDDLVLEIRDDGVGFNLEEVQPGHLGLGTMAERAQQMGGSVEIASTVGNGATVRVRVPGAFQSVSEATPAHATG